MIKDMYIVDQYSMVGQSRKSFVHTCLYILSWVLLYTFALLILWLYMFKSLYAVINLLYNKIFLHVVNILFIHLIRFCARKI